MSAPDMPRDTADKLAQALTIAEDRVHRTIVITQRDDANAKLDRIRDACEAALVLAVAVQLAEDVLDIIDGKDEYPDVSGGGVPYPPKEPQS